MGNRKQAKNYSLLSSSLTLVSNMENPLFLFQSLPLLMALSRKSKWTSNNAVVYNLKIASATDQKLTELFLYYMSNVVLIGEVLDQCIWGTVWRMLSFSGRTSQQVQQSNENIKNYLWKGVSLITFCRPWRGFPLVCHGLWLYLLWLIFQKNFHRHKRQSLSQ